MVSGTTSNPSQQVKAWSCHDNLLWRESKECARNSSIRAQNRARKTLVVRLFWCIQAVRIVESTTRGTFTCVLSPRGPSYCGGPRWKNKSSGQYPSKCEKLACCRHVYLRDFGLCRNTRSGFERPFSRLSAPGGIDDRTDISCFEFPTLALGTSFARRKNCSLSGRRASFPTEPSFGETRQPHYEPSASTEQFAATLHANADHPDRVVRSGHRF